MAVFASIRGHLGSGLSVVGFGGTTDVYYYARHGNLVAFSWLFVNADGQECHSLGQKSNFWLQFIRQFALSAA